MFRRGIRRLDVHEEEGGGRQLEAFSRKLITAPQSAADIRLSGNRSVQKRNLNFYCLQS